MRNVRSIALDIFISEVERTIQESDSQQYPEEIIMNFAKDLEMKAEYFTYLEKRENDDTYIDNLSYFINHFRAMALSKLQ